jgi:hypothetical protein
MYGFRNPRQLSQRSHRSIKGPASFVFLATLHELRSRDLVMTAAAAEEHQRHESTPEDKGEHGAKTEGNPTVRRHGSVIARRPDRDGPNNSHDEDRGQRRQNQELATA